MLPNKVKVKSMKELCKDVIINNLNCWTTDDLHSLPIPFLEELVESSANKSPDIQRLIHPKLKKIKFPNCSTPCGMSETVHLIGKFCNNLTDLDLSFHRSISSADLLQLVSKIPNIKSLNLAGTQINDNVMREIGNNCPTIEVLDVGSCSVTDNGIDQLCLDHAKSRNLKIKELNIFCDGVTFRGTYTALRYLKNLKKIISKELELTLSLLSKTDSIDSLSLETLQIPLEYWPFPTAALLCSNLKEMEITGSTSNLGIVPQVLGNFKHLTNLTFIVKDSNFGQLLPALEKIGSRLESLTIGYMFEVEIASIGYCCPKLEELKLYNIQSFSPLPFKSCIKKCQIPFTKLRMVIVDDCSEDGRNMTEKELTMVLENCSNLEWCELSFNGALSDSVIQQLLKLNPLRNLMYLELYDCPKITVLSILKLLSNGKSLQTMYLGRCKGITENDASLVKAFISENDLGVNLDIIW